MYSFSDVLHIARDVGGADGIGVGEVSTCRGDDVHDEGEEAVAGRASTGKAPGDVAVHEGRVRRIGAVEGGISLRRLLVVGDEQLDRIPKDMELDHIDPFMIVDPQHRVICIVLSPTRGIFALVSLAHLSYGASAVERGGPNLGEQLDPGSSDMSARSSVVISIPSLCNVRDAVFSYVGRKQNPVLTVLLEQEEYDPDFMTDSRQTLGSTENEVVVRSFQCALRVVDIIIDESRQVVAGGCLSVWLRRAWLQVSTYATALLALPHQPRRHDVSAGEVMVLGSGSVCVAKPRAGKIEARMYITLNDIGRQEISCMAANDGVVQDQRDSPVSLVWGAFLPRCAIAMDDSRVLAVTERGDMIALDHHVRGGTATAIGFSVKPTCVIRLDVGHLLVGSVVAPSPLLGLFTSEGVLMRPGEGISSRSATVGNEYELITKRMAAWLEKARLSVEESQVQSKVKNMICELIVKPKLQATLSLSSRIDCSWDRAETHPNRLSIDSLRRGGLVEHRIGRRLLCGTSDDGGASGTTASNTLIAAIGDLVMADELMAMGSVKRDAVISESVQLVGKLVAHHVNDGSVHDKWMALGQQAAEALHDLYARSDVHILRAFGLDAAISATRVAMDLIVAKGADDVRHGGRDVSSSEVGHGRHQRGYGHSLTKGSQDGDGGSRLVAHDVDEAQLWDDLFDEGEGSRHWRVGSGDRLDASHGKRSGDVIEGSTRSGERQRASVAMGGQVDADDGDTEAQALDDGFALSSRGHGAKGASAMGMFGLMIKSSRCGSGIYSLGAYGVPSLELSTLFIPPLQRSNVAAVREACRRAPGPMKLLFDDMKEMSGLHYRLMSSQSIVSEKGLSTNYIPSGAVTVIADILDRQRRWGRLVGSDPRAFQVDIVQDGAHVGRGGFFGDASPATVEELLISGGRPYARLHPDAERCRPFMVVQKNREETVPRGTQLFARVNGARLVVLDATPCVGGPHQSADKVPQSGARLGMRTVRRAIRSLDDQSIDALACMRMRTMIPALPVVRDKPRHGWLGRDSLASATVRPCDYRVSTCNGFDLRGSIAHVARSLAFGAHQVIAGKVFRKLYPMIPSGESGTPGLMLAVTALGHQTKRRAGETGRNTLLQLTADAVYPQRIAVDKGDDHGKGLNPSSRDEPGSTLELPPVVRGSNIALTDCLNRVRRKPGITPRQLPRAFESGSTIAAGCIDVRVRNFCQPEKEAVTLYVRVSNVNMCVAEYVNGGLNPVFTTRFSDSVETGPHQSSSLAALSAVPLDAIVTGCYIVLRLAGGGLRIFSAEVGTDAVSNGMGSASDSNKAQDTEADRRQVGEGMYDESDDDDAVGQGNDKLDVTGYTCERVVTIRELCNLPDVFCTSLRKSVVTNDTHVDRSEDAVVAMTDVSVADVSHLDLLAALSCPLELLYQCGVSSAEHADAIMQAICDWKQYGTGTLTPNGSLGEDEIREILRKRQQQGEVGADSVQSNGWHAPMRLVCLVHMDGTVRLLALPFGTVVFECSGLGATTPSSAKSAFSLHGRSAVSKLQRDGGESHISSVADYDGNAHLHACDPGLMITSVALTSLSAHRSSAHGLASGDSWSRLLEGFLNMLVLSPQELCSAIGRARTVLTMTRSDGAILCYKVHACRADVRRLQMSALHKMQAALMGTGASLSGPDGVHGAKGVAGGDPELTVDTLQVLQKRTLVRLRLAKIPLNISAPPTVFLPDVLTNERPVHLHASVGDAIDSACRVAYDVSSRSRRGGRRPPILAVVEGIFGVLPHHLRIVDMSITRARSIRLPIEFAEGCADLGAARGVMLSGACPSAHLLRTSRTDWICVQPVAPPRVDSSQFMSASTVTTADCGLTPFVTAESVMTCLTVDIPLASVVAEVDAGIIRRGLQQRDAGQSRRGALSLYGGQDAIDLVADCIAGRPVRSDDQSARNDQEVASLAGRIMHCVSMTADGDPTFEAASALERKQTGHAVCTDLLAGDIRSEVVSDKHGRRLLSDGWASSSGKFVPRRASSTSENLSEYEGGMAVDRRAARGTDEGVPCVRLVISLDGGGNVYLGTNVGGAGDDLQGAGLLNEAGSIASTGEALRNATSTPGIVAEGDILRGAELCDEVQYCVGSLDHVDSSLLSSGSVKNASDESLREAREVLCMGTSAWMSLVPMAEVTEQASDKDGEGSTKKSDGGAPEGHTEDSSGMKDDGDEKVTSEDEEETDDQGDGGNEADGSEETGKVLSAFRAKYGNVLYSLKRMIRIATLPSSGPSNCQPARTVVGGISYQRSHLGALCSSHMTYVPHTISTLDDGKQCLNVGSGFIVAAVNRQHLAHFPFKDMDRMMHNELKKKQSNATLLMQSVNKLREDVVGLDGYVGEGRIPEYIGGVENWEAMVLMCPDPSGWTDDLWSGTGAVYDGKRGVPGSDDSTMRRHQSLRSPDGLGNVVLLDVRPLPLHQQVACVRYIHVKIDDQFPAPVVAVGTAVNLGEHRPSSGRLRLYQVVRSASATSRGHGDEDVGPGSSGYCGPCSPDQLSGMTRTDLGYHLKVIVDVEVRPLVEKMLSSPVTDIAAVENCILVAAGRTLYVFEMNHGYCAHKSGVEVDTCISSVVVEDDYLVIVTDILGSLHLFQYHANTVQQSGGRVLVSLCSNNAGLSAIHEADYPASSVSERVPLSHCGIVSRGESATIAAIDLRGNATAYGMDPRHRDAAMGRSLICSGNWKLGAPGQRCVPFTTMADDVADILRPMLIAYGSAASTTLVPLIPWYATLICRASAALAAEARGMKFDVGEIARHEHYRSFNVYWSDIARVWWRGTKDRKVVVVTTAGQIVALVPLGGRVAASVLDRMITSTRQSTARLLRNGAGNGRPAYEGHDDNNAGDQMTAFMTFAGALLDDAGSRTGYPRGQASKGSGALKGATSGPGSVVVATSTAPDVDTCLALQAEYGLSTYLVHECGMSPVIGYSPGLNGRVGLCALGQLSLVRPRGRAWAEYGTNVLSLRVLRSLFECDERALSVMTAVTASLLGSWFGLLGNSDLVARVMGFNSSVSHVVSDVLLAPLRSAIVTMGSEISPLNRVERFRQVRVALCSWVSGEKGGNRVQNGWKGLDGGALAAPIEVRIRERTTAWHDLMKAILDVQPPQDATIRLLQDIHCLACGFITSGSASRRGKLGGASAPFSAPARDVSGASAMASDEAGAGIASGAEGHVGRKKGSGGGVGEQTQDYVAPAGAMHVCRIAEHRVKIPICPEMHTSEYMSNIEAMKGELAPAVREERFSDVRDILDALNRLTAVYPVNGYDVRVGAYTEFIRPLVEFVGQWASSDTLL